MPYIRHEDRVHIDPLIDQLAERIVIQAKQAGYDAAFSGLLNYACTRLALKIVRLQFGRMRYWLIAAVTGVFKNVGDEFYRRVALPYEDLQSKINGDVDLYREFDEQIEGENRKLNGASD